MIPLATRLELAAKHLHLAFMAAAPKDTWNLTRNAIRIEFVAPDYHIVLGGEIAPYVIFTNEAWVNRPGVNPNEGWIDRVIEANTLFVQQIMSGAVSEDDVEKAMQENEMRLLEIQQLHIGRK